MSVQCKTEEVFIYPDGRMDTKNASAYTGFSQKTMAMMRCNGKGPAYVKRGRIFYYREDCDSWMRDGRKDTGQGECK